MKKTKKTNTIQGERLKECLKASKLTQKELSEITSYTVQHINNIANSRRTMTREAAHAFAEVLHVDEGYLLGDSEYKTLKERVSVITDKGRKGMSAVLVYLESIGLEFKPHQFIHCNLDELYRNIRVLAPYMDTTSLEQLKKEYDFTLDQEDFFKKYSSKDFTIKLASLPLNKPLQVNDLIKGTSTPDSGLYLVESEYPESQNITQADYDISVSFEVYYNGNLAKTISEKELQDFIRILDSYTNCTIENILLK